MKIKSGVPFVKRRVLRSLGLAVTDVSSDLSASQHILKQSEELPLKPAQDAAGVVISIYEARQINAVDAWAASSLTSQTLPAPV